MRIDMKRLTERLWRILGEISIIVVGVLIALAADEIVDDAHKREEVAEFRQSANRELAANIAAFQHRVKQNSCIERRIAELERWLAASRQGQSLPLLRDIGRPSLFTMRTSVWSSRNGDVINHMPLDTRLAYASLYDELANNDRLIADEREAWRSLAAFNGAPRLSESDQMRLSELIYRTRSIGRVLRSNWDEVGLHAAVLGIRPDFGKRVLRIPESGFCDPILPAGV